MGLLILLGTPDFVQAGKLSWLDDVVQEVMVEARAGGKGLAHEVGGDGARAEMQRAGRLFLTHDADEGLEHLIRQSDELARAGRRIDRPAEALLESRFSRLLPGYRGPPDVQGESNRPRSAWSSRWARRHRSSRDDFPTKRKPWSAD